MAWYMPSGGPTLGYTNGGVMGTDNLRSAFRTLRSAPGFALTAILSLSVGIGGSVSIFTLVNSVLLRPLAFPNPGRLVRVTNRNIAAKDPEAAGLLALEFIRWRKQTQSLDSISLTTIAC